MRPAISLTVPQPCHESWADMMPTATGRHCAACAKTVVDFTLKTDAEILAHLASAASGRTCGRFAAGQLERPLQRAVPAAPAARWRTWLAAAVAVWGLREAGSVATKAQAPAEWRARYWGGPVPVAEVGSTHQGSLDSAANGISPVPAQVAPLGTAPVVLRGIVTDFSNNGGLPGATILLKGTTLGTSTKIDGTFELLVPAQLASAGIVDVTVSYIGFASQDHQLTTSVMNVPQKFQLQTDVKGMMLGEVVYVGASKLPPAPWHPRRFYYWGKYWVTRPFRRF